MNNVIVALDFEETQEVLDFLTLFEKPIYVKIGMELFYNGGANFLKEIKDQGHKIFLDLKLHDIPNTVERAMRILGRLDVDMVNLHAAGGLEMMKAARRALGDDTILLAVTQLTSTSEEEMQTEQLIKVSLEESVLNNAKLAEEAGCNGVVCSPLESKIIHENTQAGFLTVTPGIRLASNDVQDQIRITTPSKAKELGSDYIVVGRPITRAEDPIQAYNQIVKEFA